MITFIIISLAVSLLLVFSVCFAAFCETAFREPQRAVLPNGATGNWQSPLLRGRDLLDWAAATARTTTVEFLRRQRTAKTATELSSELHVGASTAINQKDGPDQQAGCPAYCHDKIAVTPPEVLGIADYLRKNSSLAEQRRVQDRAAANCRQFAVTDHRHSDRKEVRCPLLDRQEACCAFPARPIRCRGWCPTVKAVGSVSANRIFDQQPLDPYEYESRGQVVVQGAESGFRSGLKASGLDGNLYELNSALVAALDLPDAAERWANGDTVFQNCNTYI